MVCEGCTFEDTFLVDSQLDHYTLDEPILTVAVIYLNIPLQAMYMILLNAVFRDLFSRSTGV